MQALPFHTSCLGCMYYSHNCSTPPSLLAHILCLLLAECLPLGEQNIQSSLVALVKLSQCITLSMRTHHQVACESPMMFWEIPYATVTECTIPITIHNEHLVHKIFSVIHTLICEYYYQGLLIQTQLCCLKCPVCVCHFQCWFRYRMFFFSKQLHVTIVGLWLHARI